MTGDDDFYRGVICALAAMRPFDQPVIRDEIIGTVGDEDLIRVARKDGAMRWSGLSDYLREKKENQR